MVRRVGSSVLECEDAITACRYARCWLCLATVLRVLRIILAVRRRKKKGAWYAKPGGMQAQWRMAAVTILFAASQRRKTFEHRCVCRLSSGGP
jgi:hypothetical protein